MSPLNKAILAAVVVAWTSDMAVKQFTSATNSDTHKVLVRVGAAAVVGYAMTKVF
jgi:hypothetical protein